MRLVWRPFDALGLPRIVQLVNKTNQFNLTTRRLREAEAAALIEDPDAVTLQLRLTDRLGDNGVIAVVIGRLGGSDLVVETWLMSCRVLGRRVEEGTLAVLAARRPPGRPAPRRALPGERAQRDGGRSLPATRLHRRRGGALGARSRRLRAAGRSADGGGGGLRAVTPPPAGTLPSPASSASRPRCPRACQDQADRRLGLALAGPGGGVDRLPGAAAGGVRLAAGMGAVSTKVRAARVPEKSSPKRISAATTWRRFPRNPETGREGSERSGSGAAASRAWRAVAGPRGAAGRRGARAGASTRLWRSA